MRNAIVYLILIAGFFLSCSDHSSEKQHEITSADFRRLLLADSIYAINVQNDERVFIVPKSQDLSDVRYSLTIHSSEQFRQNLDVLVNEFRKTHTTHPYSSISYVSGSSKLGMIGIIHIGLIISIFALFLIAAIDILRSRFVSDIEKLIWIFVVIFVPVVGPILYLLIGRKQKVKNEQL